MTTSVSFRQAYEHLLADLAEMPKFLQRTMISLPQDFLRRASTHDAFPLIEHLWHVRDCDPDLYALRIRRLLREQRPMLEPVDVNAWYVDRRYRELPGDRAIAEFATLRADLLAELAALDEKALARVGVRADGSEIDVLGLIRQIADHDRDHRWRIGAILRGFAVDG